MALISTKPLAIDGFNTQEIGGPLFLNAQSSEGSDAAASTNTNYSIDVGDTFSGTISSSFESDWIEIDLVAGNSYTFNVWGTGGAGTGIADTILNLRNANGTSIAFNDDFEADNWFSGIEFDATTTGTYYLDVSGFQGNTGEYTLQAATNEWSADQVATWLTEVGWGIPTDIHFDATSGDTLDVNLTGVSAGLTLARLALESWTNVTGINFNEVSSGADISFTENVSGLQAFAGPSEFNPATGIIANSVVTISSGWIAQFGNTIDSFSFLTYMHEIGHALGLGHGGPYDGNATYGSDDFYDNDSVQMTVMSYFEDDNSFVNLSEFNVITPMIADIVAMERLYGSHDAYTGDTTWGANSNVGGYLGDVFERFFDNGSTIADYDDGAFGFTVQDDGGLDLLDFSTESDDQTVRLIQGSASDIAGESGNVVIAIGSVIENASTGSGDDKIIGNSADNELRSGLGADTMSGGAGDDRLYAGGVNSSLYGNDGDDFLRNDAGQTYFSGGSGDDTVAYFRRDSAVSVNLETGANNTGSTYNSIEGVIGTADHNDTLTGDGGSNSLFGGGGDDKLEGGRGNDSLSGGADDDRLSDASGADTFNGGTGNDTASYFDHVSGVSVNLATGSNSSGDTYISIENLMGSNISADTLRGDDDDNRLRGFAGDDRIFGDQGDDTIEGGAGDDYLRDESGLDVFIGGSGDDTVSYYGRLSDLEANLGTGANNSGDTYTSIESLMGSNVGNDELTGSSSSNRIWGFGGDDEINGGAGNDRLEGGDGDDTLNGGSGTDTFVFEANDDADIIEDFENGTDMIVFDINALSFGDLTIANVSGGAQVTYGTGDTILLQGITSAQLTSADFDFV